MTIINTGITLDEETFADYRDTPESEWPTNIHPGRILLEEYLEPNGITAYKLSKATGISQSVLSDIIKGKRRISVETSFKLGRALNLPIQYWSNIQAHYDAIETVRRHVKDTVHIQRLLPVG